jgi:hypothetical protein
MVLLLIGGTLCVGQMAISGTETTRSGTDQTTRFTRGLPFSPWYEEVEVRTAAGVESQRWVVQLNTWSFVVFLVGVVCCSLAWRWRWRPGR